MTVLKGEIVVASRIVDYLSSGLYESPAACLKELVNNAYDADASLVEVFVKPDANRIIVSDDGHGMNQAEFVRNFSTISESFKRSQSDTTERRRPKIGKIGIGFIAANEICDVMQIISTKQGSTEKIDIEINFKAMRTPVEERRRKGTSFSKADYVGTVSETDADSHYTHIFLKEVRGPAQELLAGARKSETGNSLYGMTAASISKSLKSNPRSWEEYDFYSRTMLEVALNVPVKYPEGWANQHDSELSRFTRAAKELEFRVRFDGTELEKPTVFPKDPSSFVRLFDYSGEHVSFQAYFYVQHGVLKPQDLNGALIRIRNAAVGKYERSFFGFPSSIGTLFQRWISAEIWADARLEEAMNIDRKTLRVTHPAYLELVDAVHEQFRSVLNDARALLYEAPARKARSTKARAQAAEIVKVAAAHGLPPSTISMDAKADPKAMLHKFSVSELLDVVFEVAQRTLSRDDFKKFAKALTKVVSGQ